MVNWRSFSIFLCFVLFSLGILKKYKGNRKNKDVGQPSRVQMKDAAGCNGNIEGVENVDVLIIGAGAAGLASAACLQQQVNIRKYVVIEKESIAGSAWLHRYERLHLHTVRDISGLPYIPMPDHFPIFPSRNQVAAYLESYWRLLQLNIRFNTEVVLADFNESTQRWTVEVAPSPSSSHSSHSSHTNYNYNNNNNNIGSKDLPLPKKYIAKIVICCTGICPTDGHVVPEFKGRGDFHGTVLHSRFFKNAEEFRGKKCLVVGCGNSGAEIAMDFYEHGCDTTILVRSPIIPMRRDDLEKVENDMLLNPITSLLLNGGRSVPIWIADKVQENIIRSHFPPSMQSKCGLQFHYEKPVSFALKALRPPLIDIGTIDLLIQKKIKVLYGKGIDHFTTDGIVLEGENDEVTHQFDVILLATGFNESIPLKKIFPPALFDKLVGDEVDKTDNRVGDYYLGGSGKESKRQRQLYFVGFNDYLGLLHEIGHDASLLATNIKSRLQQLGQ